MKNKAALTLIELSLMLLVFALAATFCMRVFIWANETSEECDVREQALLQAQNVAQVLKHCSGNMDKAADLFGGSLDEGVWSVRYNKQWEQGEAFETYILSVEPKHSGIDLLGIADIRVLCDETCLVQMEMAWQEGIPGE